MNKPGIADISDFRFAGGEFEESRAEVREYESTKYVDDRSITLRTTGYWLPSALCRLLLTAYQLFVEPHQPVAEFVRFRLENQRGALKSSGYRLPIAPRKAAVAAAKHGAALVTRDYPRRLRSSAAIRLSSCLPSQLIDARPGNAPSGAARRLSRRSGRSQRKVDQFVGGRRRLIDGPQAHRDRTYLDNSTIKTVGW